MEMPHDVQKIYQSYPDWAQELLMWVRSLIKREAEKLDKANVTESLKWGEPSYLVDKGSPIRLAWSPKKPDQVGIYFICSTKLVDTFKELYGSALSYSSNRAIILKKNEPVSDEILVACIALALNYHNVKHLPLLGASV